MTGPEVVSVAPDAGRAKMAQRFAEMIEADLAIMHKTRPAHDLAAVTEIAGRVRDKVAIVGDDVIMTGGTLLANVKVLKEQGAKEVWVFATHGLFCGDALEKFSNVGHRRDRRHRHRPDRPPEQAGQPAGALRRRAARGHDHERLRRRLGLGDLRRREPAVLGSPLNHAGRRVRVAAPTPGRLSAFGTPLSGRAGRRFTVGS